LKKEKEQTAKFATTSNIEGRRQELVSPDPDGDQSIGRKGSEG